MRISILFLFLSISSLASGGQIGGQASSGFERMTCRQMVVETLKEQGRSGLNDKSLEAERKRCLGLGSAVGNYLPFVNNSRTECFKSLQERVTRYETMMRGYVNALNVRRNIYDTFNVEPKSKLHVEVRNAKAKAFDRNPPSQGDVAFSNRLLYISGLEFDTDAQTLRTLYGTHSQELQDRNVCYAAEREYSKIKYPEYVMVTRPARPAHVERECPRANCTLLLAKPINIESFCYKNAIIDCSVDPSSGTESNSSVNTNN